MLWRTSGQRSQTVSLLTLSLSDCRVPIQLCKSLPHLVSHHCSHNRQLYKSNHLNKVVSSIKSVDKCVSNAQERAVSDVITKNMKDDKANLDHWAYKRV